MNFQADWLLNQALKRGRDAGELPATKQGSPPLPSQSSAAALVRGDWSAFPTVAAHLAGRGFLIGLGLALIPEARTPKILVGGGLAGSSLIELFVVFHELVHQTPTVVANDVPR